MWGRDEGAEKDTYKKREREREQKRGVQSSPDGVYVVHLFSRHLK